MTALLACAIAFAIVWATLRICQFYEDKAAYREQDWTEDFDDFRRRLR
jgi:hypothetical protein